MRGVAFFVISICGSLISVSCATARLSSNKQRYEVEQHLKKLNKPAVKTILSPDGDIIDCVHISKQPAFDHPLLKDHKIKMRPSYHPAEGQFDANKESTRVNANKEATNDTKTIVSQLWHNNGKCPLGTIPIRRTKEEDVLRAGSMVNMYGMKKPGSFPIKPEDDSNDGSKGARYEHAIAYVGDAKSDKYHGSKVTINVWEPYVEPNEFSSSQMWILGGSLEGRLESIEAGWHVHPELYGDNNPRLFTYWTVCSLAMDDFLNFIYYI
ncbi:unnamed protein product [Cuscuta europaea]|uniref:Neprosin PEP catalytic domain-containing protein n=1 Tax=Cuscuta europaea TaxID=41803 RepID=A0A9P1E159_CUSEU|nr:unnamed protein product [Cuscuta europaea]